MRTDKQELFIESYCQSGNAKKAAIMAGYSENTATQKGYYLKNKFAKEINEITRQMIQDSVPAAINQMRVLADSAESESVRLAANKDLLDRAGLKPTERVETQISHVEQASTDELVRELEALTAESQPELPEGLIN